MNNVKVIFTKDGSKTLHMPELNEQYYSIHGAINEAEHIFIKKWTSRMRARQAYYF